MTPEPVGVIATFRRPVSDPDDLWAISVGVNHGGLNMTLSTTVDFTGIEVIAAVE